MTKVDSRLVGKLVSALFGKRYLQAGMIVLLVAISLVAKADDNISGRVVAVADGDTLTVLDASQQQHKIRLGGIDAPEKAMPFGQVSKQKLAEICFQKQAEVNVINTDRYGRAVAHVYCNGVYANREMVKAGYAWVYRTYDKGFESFYAFQRQAKAAELGLWADPNPTPPWQWRHTNLPRD